MKRMMIFIYVWLVVSGLLVRGGEPQWPGVAFVTVKAYMYNLENGLMGDHAIVKNGKLDGTVVGEGVVLTPQQVEKVVVLTNRDIRGLVAGLSKTYIPHHGLVFYDASDQPVAYITFSFEGEGMRVFPDKKGKPITAELPDKEIKRLLGILEAYRQVVAELKLPIYKSPFEYGKDSRK